MPNATVSVTWKGGPEFAHAVDEVVDRVEKAARGAAIEAGQAIAVDARAHIHNVTGRLGRSITVDAHQLGGRYVAEVGPHGVVYALRQEGRHPYMAPAVEHAGPSTMAIYEKNIAAAMRG